MSNARTPITDLLRILSDRFREERCTQLAGSLTFTTLLALIPMLTVALTVVSAFPLFEPLLDYVQTFVINSLVPSSIDAIATYADQFSENAARLTTLGIVFLAITALLLMLTIDRAFNNIWRVSRPRPLVQRLILYCGLLTVGPVLIGASLSLTSYLITLSLGFIEETHWSLTPEESSRIWWDICWIWGPPEDHLQFLLETIGPARFVLGTGMPLRIPETPIARLDLLDLSTADRAAIDHGNAEALSRKPA